MSLFVLSCRNKTDNIYFYDLKKSAKDIVLPIDDNTNNYSHSMFLYNDSSSSVDYLSIENKQTNEINIYRLDSCSLFEKIKIERDGPNGISRFLGHKINNLNSIYVFDLNNSLVEIDIKGSIIDRVKVVSKEEELRPLLIGSVVYNPIVVIDSCLYMSQNHLLKLKLTDEDIRQSPICIKLDMRSKKLKSLSLCYPVIGTTMMSNFLPLFFSREYDGEKFIYSFYFSDKILVTTDHIESKFYEIKSCYMKPTNNGVNYAESGASDKYFYEKPYYGNLIYDKFRNVYYQFAYLESEILEKIDPLIAVEAYKQFSVIIINSKFEVIGETLFPKNTYMPTMAFVNKDGLYISASHHDNPDYNEDLLKFECFELIKK